MDLDCLRSLVEKRMPLIRIDAIKRRTKSEIKSLLDATHRAVVSTFKVPLRDRYQVYQEHAASNFIVEDTGLGIKRTRDVGDVVVVTVFS
jgi:hypothetical protein